MRLNVLGLVESCTSVKKAMEISRWMTSLTLRSVSNYSRLLLFSVSVLCAKEGEEIKPTCMGLVSSVPHACFNLERVIRIMYDEFRRE